MKLINQIKRAEKIVKPIYLITNSRERTALRPKVKAYMKAYWKTDKYKAYKKAYMKAYMKAYYQRKKKELGK